MNDNETELAAEKKRADDLSKELKCWIYNAGELQKQVNQWEPERKKIKLQLSDALTNEGDAQKGARTNAIIARDLMAINRRLCAVVADCRKSINEFEVFLREINQQPKP